MKHPKIAKEKPGIMCRVFFFGCHPRRGRAVVVTLTAVVILMMVAMVFVVPVALMHVPAVVVMVVVRMAPVSPGIRWPPPDSGNPHIPSAIDSPIAIDPNKAFARYSRPNLVADRRRWGANRY